VVHNSRGPYSSRSLAFDAERVRVEKLPPGCAPPAVVSESSRSFSSACQIPALVHFMRSTTGMATVNQH